MGAAVVRPDEAEFARLLKLLEDDAVTYETVMSEQGWLNAVYKHRWIELPATLGANLAIWTYKPDDWRALEPDLRLIHYTMSKPWACRPPYLPICSLWRDVNATFHARSAVRRPSWCDRVSVARGIIAPALRVSYPCKGLSLIHI